MMPAGTTVDANRCVDASKRFGGLGGRPGAIRFGARSEARLQGLSMVYVLP
jgi:hypothetical protein